MRKRGTRYTAMGAETGKTMKAKRDGLQEFQLHEILLTLHGSRKTGFLAVKTPLFIKKIYMEEGEVIFASSSWKDDQLGEVLFKAGKIPLEQYEESVRLMKMTSKKQGTIFVELGYLTPKDLFLGVKHQVKEILYSLFPLEYVEYRFVQKKPQKESLSLKIPLGSLIYEGVKRIDNFTRIKRELPDLNSPLSMNIGTSDIFEGIEFSPLEKIILSLVDGKRSIVELVDHAATEESPFEALRSVYILWLIGILKKNGSIGEEKETETTEKGKKNNMWALDNMLMFPTDNTE